MYFLSLLLHELAHFFVAKKLGYKMEKIEIGACGVCLYGETDEFDFCDEIKISIAGPILNLLLCVGCVALWWVFPLAYYYTSDFCFVNIVCFVFNVLPFFPLDGGRIALAILSKKLNRELAVKIVKNSTIVFAISLFVVFVLTCFVEINFSFGIVAILLFLSATSEEKRTRFVRAFDFLFKRKKFEKGILKKTIVVFESAKLKNVFKFLDKDHICEIEVVDKDMKTVKILTEQELVDLFSLYGFNRSIKECF